MLDTLHRSLVTRTRSIARHWDTLSLKSDEVSRHIASACGRSTGQQHEYINEHSMHPEMR